MHIQDGFLSTEVCLATGAISLAAVGYSLSKLKDSLADRAIPMTGMMSALVFAGQMVNFPLGIPVSGHLLGGVLAAVILGPWAACIALTMVLVVQWALFSDGGMFALGANVLHMAVLGSLGGYAVYSACRRVLGDGFRGIVVGAVVASWLSVMAAAALCCLEFRLSWHSTGQYDFSNMFALMVSFHSLIGIGEALITGSVVRFVLKQRPDLIYSPANDGRLVDGMGRVLAAGLAFALAIAAFVAPFASSLNDGLDAVAARIGVGDLEPSIPGLFANYDMVPVPLDGWQGLSVSLAGVGGTLMVFLIAVVLGRAVRMRPALAEVSRE